jgi:hypothetical protein
MTASTATLLEAALRDVVGPDARPASMTLDYGAAAGPGVARAWVERSNRSLVLAQAEARPDDGALVAAASAVFRRVPAA